MQLSPLALSFIIVAVGFAAGIVPFFFNWSHKTAHRWIAFGAGTILGAAFLHMIPEGYELAGASSLPMLLAGFLALYIIEQLALKHPHEEDKGEFHEIGFLTFLGIATHNLIDGIALGSGMSLPQLTPAIFLALILHKIPTTFSLSLLLVHGDYKKVSILKFLLVVLVAIPLGTLLSQAVVENFGVDHAKTIGRLILFSAGTFFYIGAYELLPEMHRKSGPESRIGLFFVIGVVIMFALRLVGPIL